MKRKKIIIVGGIIALMLIFGGLVYALGLFRNTPALVSTSDLPKQFSLKVPPKSNFRQGPNQCGPYSAAMFVSTFKTTAETSPPRLVEELPWKLPGGYTHPRALESLIRKQGVDIRAYSAGSLSDEQKILFLRQRIASGSPAILLTHMYDYQHYITLLGYNANQQTFFVYDPAFTRGETGMTIDENGTLPGNRNISEANLLSNWSQGGIGGFYRWYLLDAVM